MLVKPFEAPETTSFGIHIPESAKGRPVKGEILAVGPGKLSKDGMRVEPMGLHVGDVVLYGEYAGQEVEIDGDTCWMMRAEEVLGVFDGAESKRHDPADPPPSGRRI